MRIGDYVGTYNGGQFWVLDPREDEVDIEAICHSLSQNCRFNGQTKFNWTVGQHSILVKNIINKSLKVTDNIRPITELIGLLHDASEAYLSDICRPFKKELHQYIDIEESVQNTIFKAFGIDYESVSGEIKSYVMEADNIALGAEAIKLMNPCSDWLKFRIFKDSRVGKWANSIKIENPTIVKSKMIKEIYEYMKMCNLSNISNVFKGIECDYEKFIGTDVIPIISEGKCWAYLSEDVEDCTYIIEVPKSGLKVVKNKMDIDNSQTLSIC